MPIDRKLAAELARMVKKDQEWRRSMGPGPTMPPPSERMKFARVDVENTDRLREIVAEHGWPGRTLVGKKGAENAWCLAQHADRQLDFQRQALELLTTAVAEGEAEMRHLAYLTDRVRMNEGFPQVYGTQMTGSEHGVEPWPLEDPNDVDRRRREAGLEPLAEYMRRFRAPAASQ